MTIPLRAGRLIGALLLVHLATGLIVPYVMLVPLQHGFLEVAAGMSGLVRLSVLLLFLGGAASVIISIAAWPIVRERGYRLGLFVLALSVVNFTLQLVENSHWLTMLSVSQAYAAADAGDARLFEGLAIVVKAAARWAHYSHIGIVVAWLFAFYALVFRGGMVPRTLAIAGMVACVLQFTGITLPVFGGYRMPYPELFGMPLGLVNLALAGWLMVKGFANPDMRNSD